MTGDRSLVIEPIATNHIHRALEDEPDRCITLAHVEDDLTRCEFPRWSTRKAFRRVDLPRIEHGKQLVTTGFDEGHRCSPGGTPPFIIACKVCSPPLRAGMVATIEAMLGEGDKVRLTTEALAPPCNKQTASRDLKAIKCRSKVRGGIWSHTG